MGVNLESFIKTADRAGMPVRILQIATRRYRIEQGDWNRTADAQGIIFLTGGTIDSLRRASLGLRWEREGRTGVYRQMNLLEDIAVGSLYHEAAHTYLGTEVRGRSRRDFVTLLERAKAYYTGARVERNKTIYVSDNPFRIANEAFAEYVDSRARAMWKALDTLHELRQLADRQRDDRKMWDCLLLKRRLEQVRIDYEKELSSDIHGYETDSDDHEYRVVDKPIPSFLAQAGDAILDGRIPRRFMAAPTLARLYNDILQRLVCRVQIHINFATDQDQPLPASEPALQQLLKSLQEDPSLRVELVGHTDTQGSIPYNLDLSKRRATAVQSWLVQQGIDSGRLRTDFRGLGEPIADNTSEVGRARNRRVEARALN